MDDDAIAIGRILRAHGIRGECLTELYGESLFAVKLPWQVCLTREAGGKLESQILAFREASKGRVLLRLEGIDNREAAKKWQGAFIKVEESALPPLARNELREYELPGAHLQDAKGRLLGTITEIFPAAQEIVLGVKTGNDREVLLPFVKEFIAGFTRIDGQLVIKLKATVDWEKFTAHEE
jgi:16S rRNA processing protein RimM